MMCEQGRPPTTVSTILADKNTKLHRSIAKSGLPGTIEVPDALLKIKNLLRIWISDQQAKRDKCEFQYDKAEG
jgi:hypothetical protein